MHSICSYFILIFLLLERVSVIRIVTDHRAVNVTETGVIVIVTVKADDTVIEIKTVKRVATEIEKNERYAPNFLYSSLLFR